jgi:hypothetical protein
MLELEKVSPSGGQLNQRVLSFAWFNGALKELVIIRVGCYKVGTTPCHVFDLFCMGLFPFILLCQIVKQPGWTSLDGSNMLLDLQSYDKNRPPFLIKCSTLHILWKQHKMDYYAILEILSDIATGSISRVLNINTK